MKIDMVLSGYRVFYGGGKKPSEKSSKFEFTLEEPKSLEAVYDTVVAVASERGHYMSTNNCQDFAMAMLEKLSVKEQKELSDFKIDREWQSQSREL